MAECVLTRDEFMKHPTVKTWVPLAHRGEGKGVYVKVLSAKDRDELERHMIGLEPKDRVKNIRARLTVLTACDADGNRIFSDTDADELGRVMDHVTADLIFDAARKLNKVFLTDNDVSELEKN